MNIKIAHKGILNQLNSLEIIIIENRYINSYEIIYLKIERKYNWTLRKILARYENINKSIKVFQSIIRKPYW